MLDAQQLGVVLRRATRSLFRLEVQPAYDVPTDGNDFQRYLAGEALPDMERKGKWLNFLREQRDAGIYRHRVRVLRTPLSDYDRYASEWGYVYNVTAGEDTRIIDLTVKPRMELLIGDSEFWLIDNTQSVCMRYDELGRFIGADDAGFRIIDREIRDLAWSVGEPFTDWWERHPEYHRDVRAAS